MNAPDADSHPLLSIDGQRALLRFNRPREHNRIDPADLPVLDRHLQALEAARDVRVVVVTGTGTRTFSSGYTLQAVASLTGSADGMPFDAIVDRLEALPMPTIAALNGSLFGGATDIALACDFRIGVTGTRFVMPATRIGLHYYPGGMRRYVERLGLTAAKRLFLLGQPVPCEALDRLGFYDALVAPEFFEATVEEMVGQLTTGAPAVLRSMKRHLNAIARGACDPTAIQQAYEASQRSEDLKEGLAALAAKRAPVFTGR